MAIIDVNLDNLWFDKVVSGAKSVEGRLGTPRWKSVVVGTLWKIHNNDGRTVTVKVTDIRSYKTIVEYLSQEGLRRTLPGITSLEDGVAVYEKYYTRGEDEVLGVYAFELSLV